MLRRKCFRKTLTDEEDMEWVKKHTDTVIILGGILAYVLWFNSKLNDLKRDMADVKESILTIKCVLVMKGIMPSELAYSKYLHEKEEK